MKRVLTLVMFAAAIACSGAQAEGTSSQPTMTKHQMMKDCMAKQKASDGGMPKEDMKKACRDVTATERENEKTEKKAESSGKPAPQT